MAYDEQLAERMRAALGDRKGVTEKKMFGGVAFLLGGHMFCGIATHELMVRVGPNAWKDALARPYARPMDFTGRPMTGYVFVAPKGYATTSTLAAWLNRGATFVATLPAKKPAAKKPAAKKPAAKKPAKQAATKKR